MAVKLYSRLALYHHVLLVASALAVCFTASAFESQESATLALAYDAQTRGPVPIPPSERSLQTVIAEAWFRVSDGAIDLEGPCFERSGDLLFSDVTGGRVLRLTPDKRLSTVVSQKGLGPGGLAVHKDGRIFIATVGDLQGPGSIIAVKPDGSDRQVIVPQQAGYVPNDLVFDTHGGLYFTDFRGLSTHPAGGAYYLSPDTKTLTPVLAHLAMANGIALSPSGDALWITEFSRNLLHRVELVGPTTIAPLGTAVAYHFTGPAPDSLRVDRDGNVYVALYGQGRVLAFNRNGIPIGQILLPGRDEGHNLHSTNLAIKPETNDCYIVTSDGRGGGGATIFHAKTFAKALRLYSHQ